MKLLIALLILIDTLPHPDTLRAALESKFEALTAARLAEFDDNQPPAFLNYLPSIGIAYTPAGEPRPAASFSVSQVIQAGRIRRNLKNQRRAIIQTAALELEQEKQKLQSLITRHNQLTTQLQTLQKIHQINRQIFDLQTADYQAARIDPETYLRHRRAFLEQSLRLQQARQQLADLEAEILTLCGIKSQEN
ncbi:MAG: hypothetical protein D6765_06720 [Bacteroidetes bacterium]|nr:MAG: hypothetical protein D6765_06720 [Bacteroidota bacterium]